MKARMLHWGVPLFVLMGALVVPFQTCLALPVVITEIRHLHFGACDAFPPGIRYTIDAAESPGVSACGGSTSAKFTVTGDAGAKVTISLPNKVDITNGTDILSVTLSKSPTGGNISFDGSGNLTIFVGGNFKIPQGGLGTTGFFSVTTTLTVIYK